MRPQFAYRVVLLAVVLAACNDNDSNITAPENYTVEVSAPAAPLNIAIPAQNSLALTTLVRVNGTPLTQAPPLTWSTSNGSIATVDQAGVVRGVAVGTAVISARFQDHPPGSVTVTVVNIPPTVPPVVHTVEIGALAAPLNVAIPAQNAATLTAIVRANGVVVTPTPALTWSSSNNAIATVDQNGVVRGVAAGSATITGTYQNQPGTVAVTVVNQPPPPPPGIIFTIAVTPPPAPLNITPGAVNKATLQYLVFANGTVVTQPPALNWSSSNNAVATVDANGVVTGVSVGSAVITASFTGYQSGTATVNVVTAVSGFERFVTLGGSFTAGFRSGGINLFSQQTAWPVAIAEAARTPFDLALISHPGCPQLMIAPLNYGSPLVCAGRANFITSPNNVAVPGERIADVLKSSGFSDLHMMLLGGASQATAALQRNPTFLGVEVGLHDVLEAALAADASDALLTPLAAFQASVNELVTRMTLTQPLLRAVVVSIPDPTTMVPLLQPGAYFYLARDPATNRFMGKLVNANCSPVTALGQPNPLAANLLSFSVVSDPSQLEFNCDPASGSRVLSTAEIATIRQRVVQMNASLQAAASAHHWAFFDMNAFYASQLAAGPPFNAIRKCQMLPAATTAAQFQAAVLQSCPVTGPFGAPNFFGSMVSFDGIMPSQAASDALSAAIKASINAAYLTTL